MQGNPDSGIRENFACGIQNPGFWNPESHQRLESGIQVPLTKEQESMTCSLWQNPRLPWSIALHAHGASFPSNRLVFNEIVAYQEQA